MQNPTTLICQKLLEIHQPGDEAHGAAKAHESRGAHHRNSPTLVRHPDPRGMNSNFLPYARYLASLFKSRFRIMFGTSTHIGVPERDKTHAGG